MILKVCWGVVKMGRW